MDDLYQVPVSETHMGDSQTGRDMIHQGNHLQEVRHGSSGPAPSGL
jgi:hypothetical protein